MSTLRWWTSQRLCRVFWAEPPFRLLWCWFDFWMKKRDRTGCCVCGSGITVRFSRTMVRKGSFKHICAWFYCRWCIYCFFCSLSPSLVVSSSPCSLPVYPQLEPVCSLVCYSNITYLNPTWGFMSFFHFYFTTSNIFITVLLLVQKSNWLIGL